MSADFYEPVERLEKLQERLDSLLEEFRQAGDIDIFVDFLNDLDALEEDVRYYSLDFEEEFDIVCDINDMRRLVDSLLH